MKNRILIVMLSLFLVITLAKISDAAIQQGVPAFNLTQFTYSPNQTMEGFLNFSLVNEPVDTVIKSTISKIGSPSVIQEMYLVDFLTNSSIIFNCSNNCFPSYIFSNGATEKVLNLEEGSEVYFGFVISDGDAVQIKNISFMMTGQSSAAPVCYESSFRLDLLDDNSVDFDYPEPVIDSFCQEHFSSCYNPNEIQSSVIIDSQTPACQKMRINKTGALMVRAYMQKQGEGSDYDLKFLIKDELGNQIPNGNCTFSGTDVSSNGFSLIGCTINEDGESNFFINPAGDYYVCLKRIPIPGDETIYFIEKESTGNICGFFSNPPAVFTEDYAIAVSEAKFAAFNGEYFFNESSPIGSGDLKTQVQEYLTERYNNNCSSSKPCVIPIKAISSADQGITLSTLFLKYSPGPGRGASIQNNFYDLTPASAKINMTRQSIPLTKLNLTSPGQQGQNYRLGIQFNSISLGSVLFKVESGPIIQTLSPLTAIPDQSTTFTVVAIPSEGKQIMNYTWNFGDGSTEQVTTIPRASHVYTSGNFNLLVKVTDSLGRTGSKVFVINTSLSKDALNASYLKKRQLYYNLSTLQVDAWYKDLIFNSTQINSTLFSISTQLNSTNPDLNSIKTSLDSLKIPVSVSTLVNVPESSYIPNIQKINVDYLSDLGAGTSTDPDVTKNSIGIWQNDVSFSLGLIVKKITFDDNSNKEISLVSTRANSQDDLYSILELPPSVSPNQVKIKESVVVYDGFTDALGFNSSGSFLVTIAIPLKTDLSSINFYSSPAFSVLPSNNNNNGGTGKKSNILLPILIGIVVLIVLIIILTMVWKNKGGSSSSGSSNLFENPGDDLTLINYVQSNLMQGKSKPEIEQELLGQGWNKKQIDYAFKNKDNQGVEPEPAFNY